MGVAVIQVLPAQSPGNVLRNGCGRQRHKPQANAAEVQENRVR